MTKQKKWTSYRDGITKATVFTLVLDGVTYSPHIHPEYHGAQVFGERRKGQPTRYYPVVLYGPYGESMQSLDAGFDSRADAKAWVELVAGEVFRKE